MRWLSQGEYTHRAYRRCTTTLGLTSGDQAQPAGRNPTAGADLDVCTYQLQAHFMHHRYATVVGPETGRSYVYPTQGKSLNDGFRYTERTAKMT